MKTLLIVESPAKSKTIEKLLGPNYIVLSSFGHIRNLDKKNLGIDVENGFRPTYKILTERSKQIKAIQETIKKVDKVLLASDEDREGEAIAWHCAVVFKLNLKELNRICFHEITKTALENAVANPRTINMEMVNSQQARRILDRIVGFKLSPLLWKYIAPKLSAGRVQSSALKVLVDQEKEIEKFIEKKNYKTIGNFDKKINGSLNIAFDNEEFGINFLNDCIKSTFTIKSIDKKKHEQRPPPPYITSTIQQDACSRFGVGAKKIMSVLQHLYENGLITYHRTDSTNLSTQIQDEIKGYINNKFGVKYLHPRIYKSKIKCAQEAHEAIRPTHIEQEELDDKFDNIDKKIYNLIWKRTVASQMSASISEIYTIIISISERKEWFISKAEKLLFDGYKKVYEDLSKKETGEETEEDIVSEFIIDNIKEGEILKYLKITCSEKYSNPPTHYTESSIIKKMEKIGIGRPSTYSSIIETILDKKYVEKKDIKGVKVNININILEKDKIKNKKDDITIGAEKKKLVPTDLGINTIQFLEKNFTNILDSNFTSSLEEKLDNIVNNNIEWESVVSEFYNGFIPNVDKLNDKTLISQNNIDKKRFLGNNEDGKPVYAYIAKYGPVIQIGEGKDIKYVKIDGEYSVNSVKLEDLVNMCKYPKKLGMYEEKEILLKKGMYGLYINYDGKNIKILEGFDENLTLEDGIKCIVESDKKSENNSLIKKVDDYLIKNGAYGPYIHYQKKFYKIPDKYVPNDLTKENILEIIKVSKNSPKKTYKKNI